MHTFQMPISNQQWQVSIGLPSAYQISRICVTSQHKRKLIVWDTMVFLLITLLGVILLLEDDCGIGMEQMSE